MVISNGEKSYYSRHKNTRFRLHLSSFRFDNKTDKERSSTISVSQHFPSMSPATEYIGTTHEDLQALISSFDREEERKGNIPD